MRGERYSHPPQFAGRYEGCVLDVQGNCSRWNHDHAPAVAIAPNNHDSEGVGTGAGEGATGQDTGTAWVTRSTDCPEAPAQAHPLGPDGFTRLAPESVENARRAEQAERRAEDAEAAIEATRDLLDGWEHDGPDDYAVRLLIQRVRETLALGERFRTSREGER